MSVAAPLSAWPINFDDPPQGVFMDDWMLIELHGLGKIGYMHSELSRTDDRIDSTVLMTLSINRAGRTVKMNFLQNAAESLDGRPLSFDHSMDFSVQKMHVRGVVKDGKVHVTTEQFGQHLSQTYDFPSDAVMSWGALRKQHEMGYKAGTTYDISIYEPSTATNVAINQTVTIVGPETLTIDGSDVDAIKLHQVIKMPGMEMGVESDAWMSPDERALRATMQMAGLHMVMTRTTKEKAQAQFSPPEFFMPTTITVDSSIDRKAARGIEYVLRSKSRDVSLPPIPETGMQRVRVDGDSVRVNVQRIDRTAARQVPAIDRDRKRDEFLLPNAIINSEDPAVVAMAREAAGDAVTPYEIADRMRRYVTDVITSKNLDVGFASASEVCRNREGDCSEHAVLLAALGRARGLPSRVVTGIVYVPVFGGQNNVFGFHMWTQFLIGDQWVDFDAAQRESDCNPTHIAFNVDSLHDGGLGHIAFPLVNLIGNLDVKVVRIDPPQSKGGSTAGAEADGEQ